MLFITCVAMFQRAYDQEVVRERTPCATTEKRKHRGVDRLCLRRRDLIKQREVNLVPHPHRSWAI